MKRLPQIAFVVAVVLSLYGITYATLLPENNFIANTLVDDALYYLIPAQHLVAGQGYTFDGLHRTNGVEPLWAAVTIGIAALSPDRLSAMRLMVFLSGFLWVAAAVIMFASVRRLKAYAASIAGVGLLFTGFTNRMALLGMENSLGAFCFALVIAAGVHVYADGDASVERPTRALMALSVAAALVALTRVEYVILPMLLCVLVLLSGARVRDWRRWHWRTAILFGLPTLFLFGSYLVLNIAYFGMLTPVSGEVKRFYQQVWGVPYGGELENLRWQLNWLLSNSFGAFILPMAQWVGQHLHITVPQDRLLIIATGAVVAGLGAAPLLYVRQRTALWSPLTRFWLLLVAFAILHWGMMAVLLPSFTLYGIWYFPVEMMVIWLGIGLAVATCAGLLERMQMVYVPPALVTLLALWLIVVNNNDWFRVAGINFSNVNTFVTAGRWINQNLPAGQRIGSLSSGYLSYYASKDRVYNLDGLINDADYVQNYLEKGRVAQYIRREQLTYFADYSVTARWRSGISWQGNIPLNELELVRWWPMSGDLYGQSNSYIVWRILPPGTQHNLLDPCTGFCDRLSQIQFAAAVLHQYRLVDDELLPDNLKMHPDLRVVTSIYLPGQPLYHVLMSPQQLAAVPLQLDQLDIANRLDVTLGDALRLRGFDARVWRVTRADPFVITRYWQVLQTAPRGEWKVEVYTVVNGQRRVLHSSELAHGTYPAREWKAGQVVAETYAIQLPSSLGPGSYPIYVGVRVSGTEGLPTLKDRSYPDLTFVGNLDVER
jgi:hypothetical protein